MTRLARKARWLTMAAMCGVIAFGCAGPQRSVPQSREDRRGSLQQRIAELRREIQDNQAELGGGAAGGVAFPPAPRPETDAGSDDEGMSESAPVAAGAGVRSKPRCERVCEIAEAICQDADEICQIADELAESDARAACTDAQQSCRSARQKCDRCR